MEEKEKEEEVREGRGGGREDPGQAMTYVDDVNSTWEMRALHE